MTSFIEQFASTEAASGDVFTALGIDWKLLVFQIVGFVILVWALSRWVFPPLMKAVDDRQEKIDESIKAAEAAQKQAEAAEANVKDGLKEARKQAADIVATAKAEATQMNERADKQAKERAERIVAEAHEEIQKEVISAKKALEKETLGLVKQAASYAVSGIADDKLDTALIKKSIQEAKK